MNATQTLLTPAEAGQALRFSTATIYSKIKSGELAAFRVGTRYRVPADAVDRLLTRTSQAVTGMPRRSAKQMRKKPKPKEKN